MISVIKKVHLLLTGDIYKVDLLAAACCSDGGVWVGAGLQSGNT